jgi:DNA-binding MarR family transcriptional regulator
VPHLSHRHLEALDLIAAEGQTTAKQAAEVLGVSRPTVSALLRALERAGHLHGELVGGGELGYTATASGEHGLTQRRRRPSRSRGARPAAGGAQPTLA